MQKYAKIYKNMQNRLQTVLTNPSLQLHVYRRVTYLPSVQVVWVPPDRAPEAHPSLAPHRLPLPNHLQHVLHELQRKVRGLNFGTFPNNRNQLGHPPI